MSAAYHVANARLLAANLEEILELATPLPPRKLSSRELTLLTSLRVVRAELDTALAELEAADRQERRRPIPHSSINV